jgi:subtilisin family serine protease
MVDQNKRKYIFPIYYYGILLVSLLLTVLFWWFVISHYYKSMLIADGYLQRDPKQNEYFQSDDLYDYRESLPRQLAENLPVDPKDIVTDSLSGIKKVDNVLNVAIKSQNIELDAFLKDMFDSYSADSIKVTYADTVVNRLQINASDTYLSEFRSTAKSKLSNYDLLIWDEFLFASSVALNDSKINDADCSWYLRNIKADAAWDVTLGNKDVVVAVIDNGFDINHEELKGRIVKPYNVVDKSNNVRPGAENHGTHVAATIVGNANNGVGLAGIAPNCSLMPIKVSDENGTIASSFIIDGLLYAIKNKATVVNISLGLLTDPRIRPTPEQQAEIINNYGKDEEAFWKSVFDYASKSNVTCVLAAGNNNLLTGLYPLQRSRLTIRVGAVDQQNKKAEFSNFGSQTDIYAPGTHILSAKPGNQYEFLDGTSMAAPIVSGAVALLKSKEKNISNEQAIERIKKSVKVVNGLKILDLNKLFTV